MAGDFDGDGIDDIVTGAPGASVAGRAASGAAYVVRESRDAPSTIDLASASSRVVMLHGAVGDALGSSVVGTGTFDGTPLSGVAVGGRRAYLFGGHDSVTGPVDLSDPDGYGYPIATLAGAGHDRAVVGNAGDLNDDGRADILLGYPGASEAYAVYTRTGFRRVIADDLNPATAPGHLATRFTGGSDATGQAVDGVEMLPDGSTGTIFGAPLCQQERPAELGLGLRHPQPGVAGSGAGASRSDAADASHQPRSFQAGPGRVCAAVELRVRHSRPREQRHPAARAHQLLPLPLRGAGAACRQPAAGSILRLPGPRPACVQQEEAHDPPTGR